MMKHAKRILQWLVGMVVGTYIAALLFSNMPFAQRWMAQGVERILERLTATEVELGRLQVDWNGRIIVNDLRVWDMEGEEMLRIARVAARPEIIPLMQKRIRINNAQLYGLHANLYQKGEGEAPNFKFLIDAFASKDTTTHTPLDLRISQILLRRGRVTWEQRWKAAPPQPASISDVARRCAIHDLNLTAQLNALRDDTLNVKVKRMDFSEEHIGLVVNALSFALEGNTERLSLSDFILHLPHSELNIPTLHVRGMKGTGQPLEGFEGVLDAHVVPSDLVCLLPQLAEVRQPIQLRTAFQSQGNRVVVPSLLVQDDEGLLRLTASARADRIYEGKDSLQAAMTIKDLSVSSRIVSPYWTNALLDRLAAVNATGEVSWANRRANADLDVRTSLGRLTVKGSATPQGVVDVALASDGVQLGELLDNKDLGIADMELKARGNVGKRPDLTAEGRIAAFDYKGYRYRNINLSRLTIRGKAYGFKLDSADPYATLQAEGDIDLAAHTYRLEANVAQLAPHLLNLTKRYADTRFSGSLYADVAGTRLNAMHGIVQLNDFAMTDSAGTYRPGDIHLTSRLHDDETRILLISPFLEAQLTGDIEPKSLVSQVKRMVSNYLPGTALAGTASPTDGPRGATSFSIRAYNAEPLRRLLDIPLTLTGTTVANGELDGQQNALWMNLTSPGIAYGKENLRNIDLHLESNYESMLAHLGMQRQMKARWVNVGGDVQGSDGRLTTRLFFNNNVAGEAPPAKSYVGDVSIVSRLWRDPEGRQGFEGEILPSNFIISDTLWTIHPGFVSYYDGTLQVDSLQLSQGNRFIKLDGRASRAEGDTLHAQLQRINLEYIFSLINFHAVELTGEATGHAYAHSLFASPQADAYIRIPRFALNYATMGDLDIHLNWGDRPYSIFLDGTIGDAGQALTTVQGYITPKKDIDYHGLDLNVKAERVNLAFINKWTSAIFDDLEGRATGWVRIFGPFKQINIEGDALVNEGSVGVPFVGVRYHLENDSVSLRPDNIYFTGARLYDPQGSPRTSGHYASVDGHLHHDSFKNLTYDIRIAGQNILGYNFTDFGDQSFYGTVYATGDVRLQGSPGNVLIDIHARPERGTTFTYNASSPDKITETPFITYTDRSEGREKGREENVGTRRVASEGKVKNEDFALPSSPQSDLRINFDLDIDPQSTMNLLMDVRSGDKITLNGNGHMLAHYYNKGSFDLFGTYRVSRGTYNLSLQDIIRKNFDFSPDGTITFNGEPYEADLDLQAIHTVSGVSLNDINPKANFSNATTRVNCLMNIGGKAREPRVTFDFDIPSANEEEKQMVRSLISTEEERNMQVIYLLGIGRFYAYDYANDDQNQSTTAMNSILASTLSGTINQALSTLMGTTNWNFGANLRTGVDGWNDMDVEGMLQGNLLNNRLLINGNFGYRDTPVANSNFIGDFDVRYLLTRSGSVALKAYSETNDRYFTKSSLTTQGIGVLLKKDFTSWHDLIAKRKHKARRKQAKQATP